MTGAECLLRTLAANRVDVCFMNPGTSEMHFVAALDRVPGVRGVLCLVEGVCAGAADGFGRMLGRPAATLLHLGPGLANGLSNFHNARKARTPIVSIVGEHSTRHLQYDAPLSADIEAFARTVSPHVRTVRDVSEIGGAAAATIQAALSPPGHVAHLIVPADLSWSEAPGDIPVLPAPARALPSHDQICETARLLPLEGTAILLGGTSVNPRALEAAGRLASHTGVRVFADRNAPRHASGRGRFPAPPLPYFPEAATAVLANVRHLILVESQAPVSFFGYPDTPSYLLPEAASVVTLAARGEDGTAALEALVDLCGAAHAPIHRMTDTPPGNIDPGPLTVDTLGAILALRLPENAIVADEMVSASGTIVPHLSRASVHDRMPVTGGSIGQGLPVAVGAAFACPERKVVAIEGDGSGMYCLQALWTMAREGLDIVVVILANRRYRILEVEMRRTGAARLSEGFHDAIDIGRPVLDWIQLAAGMGVPATRALTGEEFDRQFQRALAGAGPHLIEAVVA